MKKILFILFIFIIILCGINYGEERDASAKSFLALSGSTEVSIPLQNPVIFPITGSAKGPVSVENMSPDLIDVKTDEIANSIVLKGLKYGQGSFVLTREKIRSAIYVAIREPAGVLPEQVSITVTGNPATKDFLRDSAIRSVLSRTSLKAGSYLLFDEYVPFDCPSFLSRGESKSFELPVKIENPLYYPVRESVKVQVVNKIIPTSEASLLMISNRPEKIEDDGILFQEKVEPQKPVRLLYYHQNSPTSIDREFLMKLTNPSTKTVEMKLLSGTSGPDQDVFFVGHRSTVRFLQDYSSDAGQIITIPPKGEFIICRAFMKPGDVVSGLVEIHLLNNIPLSVIVQAGQPDIAFDKEEVLPDDFDPFKIHPKGIFAEPNILSSLTYNAGSDDLTIPVGVSPWLSDIETGAPNQGNYGVIYKFNIILNNPSGEEKTLKIYFSPVNGIARGVFIIDSNLYETQLLRPGKTSLVTEILLSPKERRSMKICTTPQSGSCYPVKILFKSN